MSLKWIAERLHQGSGACVSRLLKQESDNHTAQAVLLVGSRGRLVMMRAPRL
jgi:hypothetical protein